MQISGNIVDVLNEEIFPATIAISNGKIEAIKREDKEYDTFILTGFIDSHIHIESSMLVPTEFAKIALRHGTLATISDPHEIANVLGVKGVEYMIANAKNSPLKFNFGAPSCVPATTFETSGATLNSQDVGKLLENKNIKFLSEVMNFPAVLSNDSEMMAKINFAKKVHKPIDGHAPNLRGDDLTKYINAGISTDHESFNYEEALEKIEKGMKILIREGSAAKNFDTLAPLIDKYPNMCMFCSDDKHPDDLVNGHINLMVKRALKLGIDKFKVLQVASINPIKHYNLNVGMLRVGDSADFIVIDNFEELNILKSVIDGEIVYKNGEVKVKSSKIEVINNFNCTQKEIKDFEVYVHSGEIKVIKAIENELITKEIDETPLIRDGKVISDISRDILKISVVNRYKNTPPSIDFIEGFNLKGGAIASSIAHDSHNIVTVGCDDESITKAVNLVIENRGAIVAIYGDREFILPLPIAGIISNLDGESVAKRYKEVNNFVKNKMGSTLNSPFMTLSFMALLVIPELKLSDKGLFDSLHFKFTDIFKEVKNENL